MTEDTNPSVDNEIAVVEARLKELRSEDHRSSPTVAPSKGFDSRHVAVLFAVVVIGLMYFGAQGSAKDTGPQLREFTVIMQGSQYSPSLLTVNQGDTVVIDITNRDPVAHGVDLPQFGAFVPGGHVQPGQTVRLEFVAAQKGRSDAATCGGPIPEDKSDAHGEELVVNVI